MGGLFQWLREKVKAAVLGGVNDALEELQAKGDTVVVPALRYEPAVDREPLENGNGRRRGRT